MGICYIEDHNEFRQKMKNNIFIVLNFVKHRFTYDEVMYIFSEMLYFKPTHMKVDSYGKRKYNEELFKKRVSNASWYHSNFELFNDYNGINIVRDSYSKIELTININEFEVKKENIFSLIEKIFVEFNGCWGFCANKFDHLVVQNDRLLSRRNLFNLTDEDLTGIYGIPVITKRDILGNTDFEVDVRYLPGCEADHYAMNFAVSQYMWFGPDGYRPFSQDIIADYVDCQENIELTPGYRRICLWNDFREYNSPKYRERQWTFRKATNWENATERHNLYKCYPPPTQTEEESRYSMVEFKTSKSADGKKELTARFYVDKKGRACEKDKADAYVERKFVDNELISQERKNIMKNVN